jgi:hypothetical protein
MILAWEPAAVAHMWDQHQMTPEQAEEAVDDPYVVKLNPDPASKSGKSDRYIGMCVSLGIVVVIVVRFAGKSYGANAWPANSSDRKLYWENRNR